MLNIKKLKKLLKKWMGANLVIDHSELTGLLRQALLMMPKDDVILCILIKYSSTYKDHTGRKHCICRVTGTPLTETAG